MYKLIFWDFDGVIKDSVEVKTQAFLNLFTSFGSEVVERIRAHHEANGGMSRFNKFPLYLQWAGIEPSELRVNKLCEEFSELVFNGVINSPWVPGVEEYLRVNPNDQIFVMVSATPQLELEQIVDKLNLRKCFVSIHGAPTGKAEAIGQTLAKLGISCESALMIGDAIADMDAAIKNSVPFLLRRHSANVNIFAGYKGKSINDLTEI